MLLTPSSDSEFSGSDCVLRQVADIFQLLSLLKVTHLHMPQDVVYLLDVLDATRKLVSEVLQHKYVEPVDPSGKVCRRLRACEEASRLLCEVDQHAVEEKQVEDAMPPLLVLAIIAVGQACESLRTAIEGHDHFFLKPLPIFRGKSLSIGADLEN